MQTLFDHVVESYDCKILIRHRGEVGQNPAYAAHHSGLKWPASKHNRTPSMVSDVVPWPKESGGKIHWNDTSRFYHFAGFVEPKAAGLIKHCVRWGGDWDMDRDNRDQP